MSYFKNSELKYIKHLHSTQHTVLTVVSIIIRKCVIPSFARPPWENPESKCQIINYEKNASEQTSMQWKDLVEAEMTKEYSEYRNRAKFLKQKVNQKQKKL